MPSVPLNRVSSDGCRSESVRLHPSAYVSIRPHTSAYVSIRQHTSAYVSIRQHTSPTTRSGFRKWGYVRIRQDKSAYVWIRQHTLQHTLRIPSRRSVCRRIAERERPRRRLRGGSRHVCLHTSAYVSIRQHTSAYVSISQHTSAVVKSRERGDVCLKRVVNTPTSIRPY